MAYESSSKARLLNELSRSRQSSPFDENAYMTATGTSFHDVLHSTPLRDSPQHAIPLKTDQLPDPFEHDSNGSTDMSIEIGRGVKRYSNGDMSSEGIFTFGNDDSQYEVTATPPIPPRNGSRKADGSLRKEASVRRATESTRANGPLKRTAGVPKPRAVSDMLPQVHTERDDSRNARDFAQSVAPHAARNTRFVASRQPSISGIAIPTRFVVGQGLDLDHTPQRTANLNATVQSTTFTANQSFMLPDIPDITELVSGIRKDGTPMLNRSSKSRSRFTSGSFKLQPHRVVESLPVPDEEKAIILSLQTLKDRISELEAENVEAQKRAERFEGEVFDLRSKLHLDSKQTVSDTGSDDESLAPVKSTKAASKLEASLKAVQDRFNRSERKAATAQISVQRVTKERDALVTQIAAAYFSNEELLRENEEYRLSEAALLTDIDVLKNEIVALKAENQSLRMQIREGHLAQSVKESKPDDTQTKTAKSRKVRDLSDDSQAPVHNKAIGEVVDRRKKERVSEVDLASRIEREVRRYREEAAARDRHAHHSTDNSARPVTSRSRSKSKPRTGASIVRRMSSPQRTASAPPDLDISEQEATTELDFTRKSHQSQKRVSERHDTALERADEDITMLSNLDEGMAAALRVKLQEEYRTRRSQRRTSNATATQGLRRRSSLKGGDDIINEGTGRFSIHTTNGDDATKTGKTVRVQSPHTSDATIQPPPLELDTGDISIMSNTSRRRRRVSGTEGMTSAFIIPDITMHDQPTTNAPCIPHAAAQCTACRPHDQNLTIPEPIPVSSRPAPVPAADDEITDATLRPAQPPALALATVIKHLEDEVTHLKLRREAQNRLYNRHDPAVSQRRRRLIRARLDALTAEIERRCDQIYALYDVLEGQKEAAAAASATTNATAAGAAKDDGKAGREATAGMGPEEVEETLMSIGLDPVELSGKLARGVPAGLDGMDDWSEDSEELPWEGLSDDGSE